MTEIEWVLDGTDHLDGGHCWCEPVLYYTTENAVDVWVHRAPDGSAPPLDVLVTAIAEAATDA